MIPQIIQEFYFLLHTALMDTSIYHMVDRGFFTPTEEKFPVNFWLTRKVN